MVNLQLWLYRSVQNTRRAWCFCLLESAWRHRGSAVSSVARNAGPPFDRRLVVEVRLSSRRHPYRRLRNIQASLTPRLRDERRLCRRRIVLVDARALLMGLRQWLNQEQATSSATVSSTPCRIRT